MYVDDTVILEKNAQQIQACSRAPSTGRLAYADEQFQDKASALYIVETIYGGDQHFTEPLHTAQHDIELVSELLGSMRTSDLSPRVEGQQQGIKC